jgi:DNA polymerase zeta
VIRIFGAAETGERVCAHIHGAFPYLYVDFPGRYDSIGVQFNGMSPVDFIPFVRLC